MVTCAWGMGGLGREHGSTFERSILDGACDNNQRLNWYQVGCHRAWEELGPSGEAQGLAFGGSLRHILKVIMWKLTWAPFGAGLPKR